MYIQFQAKESNNRLLIIDWASLGYQTIFSLEADFKHSKKNPYGEHSNLYRNVGIEVDMSTPEGTKKCYRESHFSRMIEIVKFFNPSKMIISLEGGGNWRYNAYPEYKMNRRTKQWPFVITPREFDHERVSLAHDVGKLFGAHILQYRECEGDDIVAVSVRNLHDEFENVTIVSSDGDLLQLTKYENVDIYDPKLREYKECPDGAKTFLECKVLSGDDSDNINGILLPGKKKKLGKKTAFKLYNACEGNVYDRAEADGWLDQYLLNKRLIDMDYIPDDIVKPIEELLSGSKREFADYIEALDLDFSKINMAKYSTLMSSGFNLFNQSINTEYLHDEQY